MENNIPPVPEKLPEADRIKTLHVHFSNTQVLDVDMTKYVIQLEVAGIFVKEPIHKKSLVLTAAPQGLRTKMFIPMNNFDYLEFDYED